MGQKLQPMEKKLDQNTTFWKKVGPKITTDGEKVGPKITTDGEKGSSEAGWTKTHFFKKSVAKTFQSKRVLFYILYFIII